MTQRGADSEARAAAGGGTRPIWETINFSQPIGVPKSLPPPNFKKAAPPTTLKLPEPKVMSLAPQQKYASRDDLLSRSVNGRAPHAEFHLKGYTGHRPRGWDVQTYNHEMLLRGKREVEQGLSRTMPSMADMEYEKPQPTLRQFHVGASVLKDPLHFKGKAKALPIYTQVSGILIPKPKTSTYFPTANYLSTQWAAPGSPSATSLLSPLKEMFGTITKDDANNATLVGPFHKGTIGPQKMRAEEFTSRILGIPFDGLTAVKHLCQVPRYQGHSSMEQTLKTMCRKRTQLNASLNLAASTQFDQSSASTPASTTKASPVDFGATVNSTVDTTLTPTYEVQLRKKMSGTSIVHDPYSFKGFAEVLVQNNQPPYSSKSVLVESPQRLPQISSPHYPPLRTSPVSPPATTLTSPGVLRPYPVWIPIPVPVFVLQPPPWVPFSTALSHPPLDSNEAKTAPVESTRLTISVRSPPPSPESKQQKRQPSSESSPKFSLLKQGYEAQSFTTGSKCEHHSEWKLLRIKRGSAHLLCCQCGLKWKSPASATKPIPTQATKPVPVPSATSLYEVCDLSPTPTIIVADVDPIIGPQGIVPRNASCFSLSSCEYSQGLSEVDELSRPEGLSADHLSKTGRLPLGNGSCAHFSRWKRQRIRKGFECFVCLECFAKWRSPVPCAKVAHN